MKVAQHVSAGSVFFDLIRPDRDDRPRLRCEVRVQGEETNVLSSHTGWTLFLTFTQQ
jgi:hypothetical protein